MITMKARAANRPEDYERLGVKSDEVEVWEDGMRTKPNEKSFEWWYLDASLEDGSNVVLTFMTKDPMNFNTKLKPWVSLEITDTEGQTVSYREDVSADEFSAATDHCDVRIGTNTLSGDLKHYKVHFEKDDLVADFTFENKLKAWRPASGQNIFGEHYFAWLPSVPAARVTATITRAGESVELAGTGYHDHNWGDESMIKLMHHWYWGRAVVGDYQLISTETTAEKKYGYAKLPVMMIADHGKLISGDETNMTVDDGDTAIDETTNKPIQNTLRYRVDDQQTATAYEVTYAAKKTISGFKMADQLPKFKKFLAKLVGFDGACLRFTGDITVDKFVDGKLVDHQVNPTGIWELMYFGKTIQE